MQKRALLGCRSPWLVEAIASFYAAIRGSERVLDPSTPRCYHILADGYIALKMRSKDVAMLAVMICCLLTDPVSMGEKRTKVEVK